MAIYDCFTFFNEIDLLKIRLNQYYNLVDKFVIVECAYTQQGNKKEFYFENNIQTFNQYKDKIVYIKVDKIPNSNKIINNLDWFIENFQRNAILRGLHECTDEDIIIISDLDEFIKPKILMGLQGKQHNIMPPPLQRINKQNGIKNSVKQLLELFVLKRKLLFSTEWKEFLEFSPIVIEQEPHPYYINTKENFNWYGSVIVKYKNLRLPQQLRNKIHNLPYIKNGGYHFSYLGGKNAIRKKLESIIEGKKFTISDSEKSADEYISKCLDDGIDLWNPKNHFYTVKDEEIEINNLAEIRKEFPQFFK